jgi:alpha-galactosidase
VCIKHVILYIWYMLAIVSTANAQSNLLLIDFNGRGPADSNNNAAITFTDAGMFGSGVWNGLPVFYLQPNTITDYYPGGLNLVYADGTAAVGVSVTLAGFVSADAYINPDGTFNGGLLYGDYLVSTTTAHIIVDGLTPFKKYDLACYSNNGDPARVDGAGASWMANGVGPLNLFHPAASSGILSNVPADTDGRIVIQLQPDPIGLVIVNGFELCPSPVDTCAVTLPEDLNSDCIVNFKDLAMLAMQWIGRDFVQVSNFADVWLACTYTFDPNCRKEAEKMLASEWMAKAFTGNNPTPPILFTYNNVSSATFLPTWGLTQTQTELDPNRTKWTLTYTEPVNGRLVITCEAIEYHDYPAIDWLVWFENKSGSMDTPILENIQVLDVAFDSSSNGDSTLYYNGGTYNSIEDYKPLQATLSVNTNRSFVPYGGRPSDTILPFFNVAKPDGSGIVLGIGWTGRWAATFSRGSGTAVNVKAGMEITHLKLIPGEKIRTPAILALFWSGGDRVRGHNQLRRLLLAHYTPTPNGQKVKPPIAASAGFIPFESTTETNMIQAINAISSHGLQVDTYWIDAGWYACPNGWASTVGDWTPDPARYPNGLKPVSDAAHAKGYKLLVWFEPERVMAGTPLYVNHPDWLLTPANLPPERQYQVPWRMLYYGNPAALTWAKTYFSAFIKNNGIDIYRQDLNLHPLWYWRNGEASDRQGMNEIKHVMGLYEYLDFLISDNPGLILDVCAGTGSRVDFEMMRRALNLTRSDGAWWNPIGEQSMTYGYSFWGPITGIGSVSTDNYDFRSGMGSHIAVAFDYINSDATAWNKWKLNFIQYKSIRDLYTGDFYSLTDYNLADTVWMAWQFNRPDTGGGIVQVFRRSKNTVNTMNFKLQGLDPTATYKLTDMDGIAIIPNSRTGSDLMNNGFTLAMTTQSSARIITYTKN